jgi:hypothetical protein
MKIAAIVTIAALGTATIANANIGRLDANDDGVISASEFLHVYGPERDIRNFRSADSNNDGVIDAQEFKAEQSGSGLFDNL